MSGADRPERPLELFALLLDSGGRRHRQSLVSDLERREARNRAALIGEFERISKSGHYSAKTLEVMRDSLCAQYEAWRPEIYQELQTSAFAGTETPMKGAVGRFFGAFFGMMIPALIAEAAVATELGFIVWGGGILVAVGAGIMKRTEIRDNRLRERTESETQLRQRLDSSGHKAIGPMV